jgi:hypothetical protein
VVHDNAAAAFSRHIVADPLLLAASKLALRVESWVPSHLDERQESTIRIIAVTEQQQQQLSLSPFHSFDACYIFRKAAGSGYQK